MPAGTKTASSLSPLLRNLSSSAELLSTSPFDFCVFSTTEQDSEEQKETARSLAGARIEGGNINESNTKFLIQSRTGGDSLLADREVAHGELIFLARRARPLPLLEGNSRKHKMIKLSKLYCDGLPVVNEAE